MDRRPAKYRIHLSVSRLKQVKIDDNDLDQNASPSVLSYLAKKGGYRWVTQIQLG